MAKQMVRRSSAVRSEASEETELPSNVYNDFPDDMSPELRGAIQSAIVGIQPVIRVTPKLAELFLEPKYNHNNRPESKPNVKELAQKIIDGEWEPFVGDSVIFSRNPQGKLGGGSFQHRCKALLQSGVPDAYFDSVLIPNLPASAANAIDTGKGRAASDVAYRLELFSDRWEKNPARRVTASRDLASALRLADARYRLRLDVNEVKGKFGAAKVGKYLPEYQYLTDLTSLVIEIDNDYFRSADKRGMITGSLSVVMPKPFWILAFQTVIYSQLKDIDDKGSYAKLRQIFANLVGSWIVKGLPKDMAIFLKKFGIGHGKKKATSKDDSRLVPGFIIADKTKHKDRYKEQIFHAVCWYMLSESGRLKAGKTINLEDGTVIAAVPHETIDSFMKSILPYDPTTNPDGWVSSDDEDNSIDRLSYFGGQDTPYLLEDESTPDSESEEEQEEVEPEPEEVEPEPEPEQEEDSQFEEEVEEEEEKPVRRKTGKGRSR